MLAPIKAVYKRDSNKDKHVAFLELAYIYFMYDPRSDYQYLVDEDDRREEVIRGLGLSSSFKEDDVLKKAIELYKSFKPASAGLLEDTRYAVNKLRIMLRAIDLDERDANGKPIHTLSSITQTIKQIPALIKDLDEAEKALGNDIKQSSARGSASKALLEDED